MGKKTKKEKILAEYRRKLRLLETFPKAKSLAENSAINTTPVDKPIQYQLTKQEVKAAPAPSEALGPIQDNFGYVFSDLKRIFFLTILAICAQLVLWYLLRK